MRITIEQKIEKIRIKHNSEETDKDFIYSKKEFHNLILSLGLGDFEKRVIPLLQQTRQKIGR